MKHTFVTKVLCFLSFLPFKTGKSSNRSPALADFTFMSNPNTNNYGFTDIWRSGVLVNYVWNIAEDNYSHGSGNRPDGPVKNTTSSLTKLLECQLSIVFDNSSIAKIKGLDKLCIREFVILLLKRLSGSHITVICIQSYSDHLKAKTLAKLCFKPSSGTVTINFIQKEYFHNHIAVNMLRLNQNNNKSVMNIEAGLNFASPKRRRSRKPCSYYPNCTASRHIESNPSPQSAKCRDCEKTVKSNHKRFLCNICCDATHAKCTGLTQIKQIRACTPKQWICPYCISSQLPFHTERFIDLENSTDTSDDNST